MTFGVTTRMLFIQIFATVNIEINLLLTFFSFFLFIPNFLIIIHFLRWYIVYRSIWACSSITKISVEDRSSLLVEPFWLFRNFIVFSRSWLSPYESWETFLSFFHLITLNSGRLTKDDEGFCFSCRLIQVLHVCLLLLRIDISLTEVIFVFKRGLVREGLVTKSCKLGFVVVVAVTLANLYV